MGHAQMAGRRAGRGGRARGRARGCRSGDDRRRRAERSAALGRLSIPAIGVDAGIIPVGVTRAGHLAIGRSVRDVYRWRDGVLPGPAGERRPGGAHLVEGTRRVRRPRQAAPREPRRRGHATASRSPACAGSPGCRARRSPALHRRGAPAPGPHHLRRPQRPDRRLPHPDHRQRAAAARPLTRRVSRAAVRRHGSRDRARRRRSSLGNVTATPATGWALWSSTAAATLCSPGVTSPSSVAWPRCRVSDSTVRRALSDGGPVPCRSTNAARSG